MKRPAAFCAICCVIAFLFIVLAGCDSPNQSDVTVPSGVRKQVAKLRSGSARQKINAARELGRMGEKAAPSAVYLVELIDSPESYETLWNKLCNSLILFSNSRVNVKDESQKALVMIGTPAVGPLSKALLDHPRSPLRYNAAIVLGRIKDVRSVDPLISALTRDTDYEVRMWAADALGKLSEKWSVDTLAGAVPALIEALKDKDPNVRQKAAYALGTMKAVKAIPALIEALQAYGKNSDAGLALFMITGQRLGDDPQKWQQWWKESGSH